LYDDLLTSSALLGAGSPGVNSGQLIILAGALLCLTLVMRSTFRRARSSRQQPRSTARQVYAALQSKSETRSDVEKVMLELDQLARRIHGQIDTKFAKLEAVIRDADERIDRLSRMTREVDGKATVDVTVDDQVSPTSGNQDSDSRHAAIFGLADRGMPPVEIAEEVGLTTGEVELILALRRVKQGAKNTGVCSA